jgi:exosortase/archaeosortase family protein
LWVVYFLWTNDLKPLGSKAMEYAIVAIACLLVVVPQPWFAWAAITLVGLRVSLQFGRIGALCVYCAVPPLWGRIPVSLVGLPILNLDAHIAAFVAGYKAEGNLIVTGNSQSNLGVYWACSSFHGINYMILAWFAFRALSSTRASRGGIYLVAGIAGVVLINWTRLVLMVRFPEYFESLHYGDLSQVVAMLVLAWMVGICWWAYPNRKEA